VTLCGTVRGETRGGESYEEAKFLRRSDKKKGKWGLYENGGGERAEEPRGGLFGKKSVRSPPNSKQRGKDSLWRLTNLEISIPLSDQKGGSLEKDLENA